MTAVEEYDAIVYDLDGTVVRLAVDWGAAADDVAAVYRDAGYEPTGGLWELLDGADAVDLGSAVESVLADHERRGARRSERLDRADELLELASPAAICSLNCEAACREALSAHGLADAVDAVVGRDTVDPVKPEPGSLMHAVDALGASPDRVLFVGDSERDAVTAERAGVDFDSVD